MKKILIDAVNFNRGGAVQVTLSVIQNASKDKNFKWFLAINPEIYRQLDIKIRRSLAGIKIFEVNSLKTKWTNSRILKKYVQELKPDLVFSVFGPAYWKSDVPHIQGFAYPLAIYPVKEWLNTRNLFGSLTDIVRVVLKRFWIVQEGFYMVETETVQKLMARKFRIPVKNIFVVQNSVSSVFKTLIKGSPVKYPDKKNTGLKIFVPAAYYCHKNLEIIPFVSEILVEKGFKNFKFILIIPKTSQGWRNIERFSKKRNVVDKILTLGPLPHAEMAGVYKECDLVFLPTLVEASTAVYPEAFLARKPLITSDRQFAKELCGDGAVYVNPRDPKQMADKIIELIANADFRNGVVKNGFRALKQNYPTPREKWNKQLSVFGEIIKRIGREK